jgi:hypothetical protein
MTSSNFDTLKFVQRLEKAGASRDHATAEAEALAEVFLSAGKDIATKSDLEKLETRLESKIDAMELGLTVKLGAFMAASVGSTVALIKLL